MLQAPKNVVRQLNTPQHGLMGFSSVYLESHSFKLIGIMLLLLSCFHVTYFHIWNVESGQSSHDAWTTTATATATTAATTEGPYSYKLDATASSATTA